MVSRTSVQGCASVQAWQDRVGGLGFSFGGFKAISSSGVGELGVRRSV